MEEVNIGLIGCGHLGLSVHLKLLQKLAGVRLVAIADTDRSRLAEAKRRCPAAAAFSDYHELLESGDVHAVIVALPNALHADAGIAALQAGKHVYLEKPIALDCGEARKLLQIWEKEKLVGMMGMNHRFHEMNVAAKDYLDSGRLGKVISVRTTFTTAKQPLPEWKERIATGGGVLPDLATHHVDLLRFLFGQEISEVFATLASLQREGDTAFLRLRLSGNIPVECFFSWCTVNEDRYEIFGEKEKLTVDRYLSSSIRVTDAHLRLAKLKHLGEGVRSLARSVQAKLSGVTMDSSYAAAVDCFVNAVRAGSKVHPDFLDGYRALEVLDSAYASDRSQQVIKLNHEPLSDWLETEGGYGRVTFG